MLLHDRYQVFLDSIPRTHLIFKGILTENNIAVELGMGVEESRKPIGKNVLSVHDLHESHSG